jgi:hypothetical protein
VSAAPRLQDRARALFEGRSSAPDGGSALAGPGTSGQAAPPHLGGRAPSASQIV